MSTLFEHTTVYPSQRSCHGPMCYCFYGTNPLDTPTDDDDFSVSSSDYFEAISDISSVTIVAEEDELPPIVREVIAPFLEPEDEPLPVSSPPAVEQNTHLYFDEDGNTISKEKYHWLNEEEQMNPWAFRVNKITFRHPRALLAYFRMVDLVNEVAEENEKISIPPIPEPIRIAMLNHPSFEEIPREFQEDILDLMSYIFRYSV